MDRARKTNIFIYLLIIVKGFIIGIANIIPGLSGGTVALILNIYERMIAAIGNLSFSTVKAIIMLFSFRKKYFNDFKKEMMRVDAIFLILIAAGAGAAIVIFSNLITILLETRHDITYGFFFGLILTSIVIPFSKIKKKNLKVYLSIIIGIALIIALSFIISDEQQIDNARTVNEISMASQAVNIDAGKLIMMFLTGMFVTSAMILPGISGSFVALVMGQYFLLLQAVSERDLLVLGIFAIGGIIGLKFFAKAMNYLFKKCHDILMAFISGLVLGSLWIMWPFKNTFTAGGEKLYLSNQIPDQFGRNEWFVLAAFIAGIAIVISMMLVNRGIAKGQKRSIQ